MILSAVWVIDLQHCEATTENPTKTRALGEIFGKLAKPGMVILLNGNLGAGKTCFAQGVGEGLGVPRSSPVTSPSYTLLNIHYGRIPLYHFDLYRLSQVDDLTDLGYDEYAEGDGLTLVEWADRMTGGLQESIVISIRRVTEEKRHFLFEAKDEQGASFLQEFSEEAGLSKPS